MNKLKDQKLAGVIQDLAAEYINRESNKTSLITSNIMGKIVKELFRMRNNIPFKVIIEIFEVLDIILIILIKQHKNNALPSF